MERAFGVVEGLRHDAVIGVDVIEPYDVELDVKEGRARLRRVRQRWRCVAPRGRL